MYIGLKLTIMNKKKYVLKYEIILEGADPIKGKEINIKNCFNEFNAKVRLEGYLKKKYVNFKSLVVTECKEDIMGIFGDMFSKDGNDIFSQFGDIFGTTKG